MAANNEGTIITTRGLHLLTKLAGARGQIEFTNVKVGTGTLPQGSDPAELTHLVAYKMDGMIAGYGYDEEAKDAYVVMQIMNTGIESGFIMTEVGLYAADPDLGEILYAYVDLSNDPNHIMPSENGRSKTVQIKLHVIVGEVTEIHATINPLSQVTREEFDRELGTKVAASHGDISDTEIVGFTDSTDQFPVPAPGDSVKVGFGKIRKFFEDIRNTATGACFIGQIVNNCVTDRADRPLSAAQGKGLMELCTKLNSDIQNQLLGYKCRYWAGVLFFNGTNSYTLNHNFGFPSTNYFIVAIAFDISNQDTIIYRAVNVDGNSTTFYAKMLDHTIAPDIWARAFAFGI